jgi:hypothetical protein
VCLKVSMGLFSLMDRPLLVRRTLCRGQALTTLNFRELFPEWCARCSTE